MRKKRKKFLKKNFKKRKKAARIPKYGSSRGGIRL